MLIFVHRINSIAELREIPEKYGVEIDVRHDNRTDRFYLNHELGEGDDLEAYLKEFRHAGIIFNVKETGCEDACLELAKRYSIPCFFILDAEFPWVYYATERGVREIALRYSEAEPVEQALVFTDRVDWVWIDTNTKLPLSTKVLALLDGFKTCLVCPERWGRPEDIPTYQEKMDSLEFVPDGIMTASAHAKQWEEWACKNGS